MSRSRYPWLVVLNGRCVTAEYAAEVREDVRRSTEAQGLSYGLTDPSLIRSVQALLPLQSSAE